MHPSFSRGLTAATSVLLGLTIAACGGSDGEILPVPPPPVVTATADTLTLGVGASAQLLGNDRLGTAVATAGAAGNVTFTLTTSPLPAGVTVTNGSVSIGAAAVPGVISLAYRICEAGSNTNCASTTAQITVPAPAIVGTADSFTLGSGASGDVLANDTLGGAPATAAQVTANATGTLPTGITLSAAGLVAVGPLAVPGTYTLPYRICQTTVPANCATATATVVVPAQGTVSGRAIDSASALGVPGVRVSVGALSTTTDANGAFSLAGLAAGDRVTVLFSADTHAETARVTPVSGSSPTDVQARLVRVGATADLAVATGGTVNMAGSPAQVVLQPDSVQRADGSVPTGTVRVRMTPINPASDSAVMPGDYTTLVGGSGVPIESFGALNVTLTDSAGVALNLRSGQSALLRIPVSTRGLPADTMPLFFFDNATGRWVAEGTATLAGNAPNQYYEGIVRHFTTWNADQVMDTARVTGCVADANGLRVAGARIYGDGVNYSGTSQATSDTAGNFTIPIRRNSQATLVAQSGTLLSNTLSAGPYGADTTLPACLTLGQAGSGVTMKLTWGAAPDDLDSHLYTPSGSHVFYSSRGSLTAAPFVNLDVDDTSSFGPEVVTITKLMVGTYKYAVKNFSGQASTFISASGARVELSLPGRAVELFVPPAGDTGSTEWWLLFELDVDAACNITVRRQASYTGTDPVAGNSSTPVYCTR